MQLIFQIFDHATVVPAYTPKQIAGLYKPYDLIDALPDGANLGTLVVTHPWFRVLHTSMYTDAQIDALLSSLAPVRDSNNVPTTLFQKRGNFLNLAAPAVTPTTSAWLADKSRLLAHLVVDPTALNFAYANLLTARAALPDPDYPGLPSGKVVGP